MLNYTFVRLETNSGNASRPSNTGIEMAKGEYVAFAASDDYVTPDFVEVLTDFMPNCPDVIFADYAGARYRSTFGDKKNVRIERSLLVNDGKRSEIATRCFSKAVVVAKAYRRTLLLSYGIRFDEHIARGEDRIFSRKVNMVAATYSVSSARIYMITESRGLSVKPLSKRERYDFCVAYVRGLFPCEERFIVRAELRDLYMLELFSDNRFIKTMAHSRFRERFIQKEKKRLHRIMKNSQSQEVITALGSLLSEAD